MAQFHISEDPPEQRSVAFVYDPLLVAEIKTNHGYERQPTGKILEIAGCQWYIVIKNF